MKGVQHIFSYLTVCTEKHENIKKQITQLIFFMLSLSISASFKASKCALTHWSPGHRPAFSSSAECNASWRKRRWQQWGAIQARWHRFPRSPCSRSLKTPDKWQMEDGLRYLWMLSEIFLKNIEKLYQNSKWIQFCSDWPERVAGRSGRNHQSLCTHSLCHMIWANRLRTCCGTYRSGFRIYSLKRGKTK